MEKYRKAKTAEYRRTYAEGLLLAIAGAGIVSFLWLSVGIFK